jgi:hypothetical protein
MLGEYERSISVVFSQHSLRTDKLVAKRQKAYAEHLKHKPNECGKTFAKSLKLMVMVQTHRTRFDNTTRFFDFH